MANQTAKKTWLNYLPAILIALLVLLVGAGAVLLSRQFHQEAAPQKKMVQQVTIVTPPPPPPPPPEPPKQPEIKEEEIPKEDVAETPPDPGPEQAPPGSDLGVDAEGGAGGDGFGLVGRKGGRGLLGGGGYEQLVRQEVNEMILDNPRLKHMGYVATITLRIADNGEFEHIEVELVSGDADASELLKKVLEQKKHLSRARPLEAASLVRLRVKSIL